ncbi:MAG: FG-GAP-like repeat-containing protein, partial [Anaerolineae bacterium]
MSASVKGIIALTVLCLVAGCGKPEPTASATPVPPTLWAEPTHPTQVPSPAREQAATQTPIPPTAEPSPTLRAEPTQLSGSTEATQVPSQAQGKTPTQAQDKAPTQAQDKAPMQAQDKAPTQAQDKAPTATPAPPTQTSAPPTPASEPGLSFVDSGQRLGAGGNFLDAALGDLDGDGDLDAVIGNDEYEAGNAVLLNDGKGVFLASGQSFGKVSGLALGDLDGDGDLDAFATSLNRAGRVWLNDGGTFSDSGQMLSTVRARKVALGDLDGDGDLDAFVAREQENTIWLNDGQGEFSNSGQNLGNVSSEAVALGDLDGDGDLDALTAGWDETGTIWLNDGQGTLTESGQIPSPNPLHVESIALGDVDNDGDLDAFLAGLINVSSERLWFNAGGVQGGTPGTFVGSGQSVPNLFAGAIALGDLDKDGDLDAFMGVDTGGPDGIESGNMVWLNDGGVFSDSGLRLGQASSQGILLEDLDGDGDLDAFVVNREEFSVPSSHPEALSTSKVWFNTTTPPDPARAVPHPFDVAWDDYALFSAGLIEAEQATLDQLPGATVYHIDLQIPDDFALLQGQEQVLYTNQEREALDEVCFRLYANAIGGTVSVSALKVDGQDVEPVYEGLSSVLRVPLLQALQPGEQVVIFMDFEVEPPRHLNNNYGTFSYVDGVLALDGWYPVVAVYDDEGAGPGSAKGWNLDVRSSGDLTYLDASFYLVRVTAPAALTIIASGGQVGHEREGGRQIATFAAGPSRDFYLVASDRYTVVSATVGETAVNSYAPAEHVDGAELALEFARGALGSFNERLGVYPYTKFDIVSTPMQAIGVEYAGVVVLAFDAYDLDMTMPGVPPVSLESVIAHETAHQWFYNVVGNDQSDQPWLDEAIVQYVTGLYHLDVGGERAAQD